MDKYFDLSVSIPVLLARLGCAVALGAILAWRPLAKRPIKVEVSHALLIMTVAAAMVVVVIGDSLARAFGVVGLGSFIRFRSSIKDPRDVTLFFLAIGTGMACGLGAVPVAAVGVGVLWALLVALDWTWAPPPPAAETSDPWATAAPRPLEFHR
ncbi:MAG TPA: DUF4956 domain-containing protein [Planctomycetota bacterium]|nr:DUF4956 domain-containing protein [Planctomycetota bacterium]